MPSRDQDYPNSALVFGNDKKRSDNDPDREGSVIIVCPSCGTRSEFWISCWNKIARTGSEFLKLSFRAKSEAAGRPLRDDAPWKS